MVWGLWVFFSAVLALIIHQNLGHAREKPRGRRGGLGSLVESWVWICPNYHFLLFRSTSLTPIILILILIFIFIFITFIVQTLHALVPLRSLSAAVAP